MKKIYILVVALFCLGIGVGKAQYNVLLDFNSWHNPQGLIPNGTLILSGDKFYGVTESGGGDLAGNIFSIDTDGSGYRDLFEFNGTNGQWPAGSLLLLGGRLYGTTVFGGTPGMGNVFSVDTNGHGFKDLFDFVDSGTIGMEPEGGLTYSNGRLYGIIVNGGNNCIAGGIFSIDTDGSGYEPLAGCIDEPGSSLILSGGLLFGTSFSGGINRSGFIFSLDTNGTMFKDVHDFDTISGSFPNGQLICASNVLYGTTEAGGKGRIDSMPGYGTIFSVDTNGNNYKILHEFNDTDGVNPQSALTLSVTGDTLFGMTYSGGANNKGCVFYIGTNGSGYTDVHDFDSIMGMNPEGALTLVRNTLYGTTSSGGLSDDGIIFSCKTHICSNKYIQPICIVTVDTATNKNIVIWGRNNTPPDTAHSSYAIYGGMAGYGDGYLLLNKQPLNALSEYVDTTSTYGGPVSYVLFTVDSCGESMPSAPHTTIYLTVTATNNANNLGWSAYQGFTPTQYRIFRGPSLSALKQIDSVANNILTYTDTLPPINSVYAIEAVSPNGVCIPTTHRSSNHLSAMLSGSFSNGFNTAVLGVQHINAALSKLNIYPNPSNGNFTLTYSLNGAGNVSTTIINELGQIVYNTTAQKNSGSITEQLNLENLTSGIYSLRLQTDNSITVRKLVLMGNK